MVFVRIVLCIFCIGIFVCDFVFCVDVVLVCGSKVNVIYFDEICGGNVFNVVIVIVWFGGQVIFVGLMGDVVERFSDYIFEWIVFEGIDISYFVCVKGVVMLVFVIMIELLGEWIFIIYCDFVFWIVRLGEVDVLFVGCCVVFVESCCVLFCIDFCIEVCWCEIFVVVGVDCVMLLQDYLLDIVLYLLFVGEQIWQIFGVVDDGEVLKWMVVWMIVFLVVICGLVGMMWLDWVGVIEVIFVFVVQVVDMFGVGDVFYGVFILCIVEGVGFLDVFCFVLVVVVLKCVWYGGGFVVL